MTPMRRSQNWLPYVFNDLFDNDWMIKANSTAPAINVIESEKNEDKKEGRYLRREFSYSKFQQTMVLPENAEKEKIEAKVENGVLNIIIPKMSEEAAKKAEKIIEIK